MNRLILAGLLVLLLSPLVWAQSNLYKMRNGAVVTPMGQELIDLSNTLCTAFSRIQGHLGAMTRQREGETSFDVVAAQWGVIDVTTNAPSETSAEAMYAALNSMIGNGGPSVLQWCYDVKQ